MTEDIAREFATKLFKDGFIDAKDQDAVAEEATKWFAKACLEMLGMIGNG